MTGSPIKVSAPFARGSFYNKDCGTARQRLGEEGMA